MTEYDACGRQLLSRLDTTNINHDDRISAYQWRCLQQALREECAATKGAWADRTERRLQRLGQATGLSPIDVDILEIPMRYHLRSIVELMIDHVFYRFRRTRPLNVISTTPPMLLGV